MGGWLIPIIVTVACIARVCVVALHEFNSQRPGPGFVTMSASLVYGVVTATTWAVFFFLKWVLS